MGILEATLQEINVRVDAEHSDIIQRFLDRLERPEPCECGFHLHCREFDKYLREYIRAKRDFHTLKKANRYVDWRGYSFPTIELTNRLTIARNHLVSLAPCSNCIRKLNPTHRRKSSPWNPLRARAWKELLS